MPSEPKWSSVFPPTSNVMGANVEDGPTHAVALGQPAPQTSSRRAMLKTASCGFGWLAFALEQFDGLGSFHETDEHNNKLRDDGSVLFPGQEKPVAYQSSRELMDLLAQSDRVRESLT